MRASDRVAAAVGGAIVAIAAALVFASIRRPAPPTFEPTPAAPAEAGERLVGPIVYTIDASSGDEWRYFSFARGSVLAAPAPRDWDLAFRRFHIIANGGAGFTGDGGIVDLGEVAFDSVYAAPASGYQPTRVRRDSVNPAIERWYDYGFTSHLLTPKPRVYAVRTSEGRYAKLEVLSYYCEGERPGCITFRYVYQGDGSTTLAPAAPE